MAQLTVRNLDEAVVAALKARAARNGRSAEAEHQMLLRETLLRAAAADDFFARARKFRTGTAPDPGAGADTKALIHADRARDDPA